MTFSSASLSDCGVDDVVATAAGVTCLRGGGRAACWRVAGAKEGAAGATASGVGAAATGPAAAGCVAAGCLGKALRAIRRGFGNGTFGLAQDSTASADRPAASARLIPKEVDRQASAV